MCSCARQSTRLTSSRKARHACQQTRSLPIRHAAALSASGPGIAFTAKHLFHGPKVRVWSRSFSLVLWPLRRIPIQSSSCLSFVQGTGISMGVPGGDGRVVVEIARATLLPRPGIPRNRPMPGEHPGRVFFLRGRTLSGAKWRSRRTATRRAWTSSFDRRSSRAGEYWNCRAVERFFRAGSCSLVPTRLRGTLINADRTLVKSNSGPRDPHCRPAGMAHLGASWRTAVGVGAGVRKLTAQLSIRRPRPVRAGGHQMKQTPGRAKLSRQRRA
jgi:hypothetical protein